MNVSKLVPAALACVALAAPARAEEAPVASNPASTPKLGGAVIPIPPPPPAPRVISDLVLRRPAPAGVREVEAPGLPDTAMAEMTFGGPVIFYNPALFQAAGGAREFVRAHELAHVLLDHLQNPHMLATDEGRAEAEAEADCAAAKSSSPSSVMAMVRLLLRRPPEARDAIYGTKPERARRILACAGIREG